MKILTITAQKPHSTGSGFYLTEMVKGFATLGHEQAVLAGVYREDTVDFPTGSGDLSSPVSGNIHCQRGVAGMPGMWILP